MITISLCMIVKNEAAVLGRILEPMKQIADEIILVDTGSTDQTKAIAAQYTSLIFDFPWIEDFSAARNFACSKASMDYWIWLDADDMISPKWQKEFLSLKETLDPAVDMVMMKYVTGFDRKGNPAFSYYRERLIKNQKGFLWKGRVHEAVTPEGRLLYSPIEIEHKKEAIKDPDRNLKIYEAMLKEGNALEPRHQFYYARELFYHNRFKEAAQTFRGFLEEPDGWVENQIDACLHLSRCYSKLGMEAESLKALLYSLSFDLPRAEICCELGRHFMERQSFKQAIYWYKQALSSEPEEQTGAFFQKDFHDYIPLIQLCVCYDRLGQYEEALKYHKRTAALKPDSEAVRLNQLYFDKRFSLPSTQG